MRVFDCECCRTRFQEHQVKKSSEAKAAGCLIGLAAGASSKNPLTTIGMALVGALVGHFIDEQVIPSCPLCGQVLKAVAAELLGGHPRMFSSFSG